MQTIFTVVHVLLAVALIGLVLLQHGKGADAGAAFGSGASATVFGAQGSGSFLTRSTAIIAALFFMTSMALAYFAAKLGEPTGLMGNVEVPAAPIAPTTRTFTVPVAADVPQPAQAVPAAVEGSDVPAAPATDTPVVPVAVAPSAAQPSAAQADVPAVPAPAAPATGTEGAAATEDAGAGESAGDKPASNQ